MEYACINNYQSVVFKKDITYLIELWGAGALNGGREGYSYAIAKHTNADTTLYLYVGGSPINSQTPYSGGWNGGGAGGSISMNTDRTSRGYGGGGATDLRTNTSTSSPQQYKLLVAGGAGGGVSNGNMGGGAENNGYPFPQTTNGDGSKTICGGAGATASSYGVGGLAPYVPAWDGTGTNDFTYPVPSGGGGGGGYNGGGGGSTGIIRCYGTNRTFGAGGAGNTSGLGGQGGAVSSSYAGTGYEVGAGGGGGSNYFKSDYAYFITGKTVPDYANGYGNKPYHTYDGVARVVPILSSPEIRGIYREGNKIIVKIGKTLNNGEDEVFYVNNAFGKTEGVETGIGYGASYTISGSETVTVTFNVPKKDNGDRVFTVSMTNGIESVQKSYSYYMSTVAPIISFNQDIISRKLMQGDILDGVFSVSTQKNGIEYLTETEIFIDDEKYFGTIVQDVGESMLQLPYLYDGKSRQTYRLKVRSRVCQTADSPYGTGTPIWSDWIETNEMLVYAVTPQNNNLVFSTNLKNIAIERGSKINISWIEKNAREIEGKEYRLMLYEGNSVVQYFDTPNTNINVLMDYPHNRHYRFGISILINGFLSEVVYSDTFFITDINTNGKISVLNDLTVSTNIDKTFDRIEVSVNDSLRILSGSNINSKLDLWFFKNGNNTIDVRVYATNNDFIHYKYTAYIAYDESQLKPNKVLNVTSAIAINGQESNSIKLVNKADEAIDLGVAEKELSAIGINGGAVVSEVTQKITVTKLNQDSNNSSQLIEILGSIE